MTDDENAKATLVNIEHVVDDLIDSETYEIRIDTENKTDNKIVVQSDNFSIDDTMSTDTFF